MKGLPKFRQREIGGPEHMSSKWGQPLIVDVGGEGHYPLKFDYGDANRP